ncbi:hypothetical protein QMM53_06600 [Leptospira santarosai]|uniref:Uncharacterized protein n=2 Tax=Leptospira santarosai TaxID=28183 RepID=A0A2P1QPC4_9LEPT|nr:hypothetical protein [Leptospira santarosai]AVQ10741.1 Uncharacterized protein XB16_0394 [Leptospira santarosai]MDI7156216.1 hypothetical protein [Leptospira santarosai]
MRRGIGALDVLFMHYFPGRKLEYPDDGDERHEFEIRIAAEIEYIRDLEMNTLTRAIVKAFNGD